MTSTNSEDLSEVRRFLWNQWNNHGDIEALNTLVAILNDERHFHQIKRILTSVVGGATTGTIRDVLQDTMKTFVHLVRDEARRQQVEDPFGLVVKIGIDLIRNERKLGMRRLNRVQYAPTQVRETVPEQKGTSATQKVALAEAVAAGLEHLDPKDRTYVEFHLDGLNYDQMAEEAGLSRDAAKKNAERARRRFREAIERHYPQLAKALAPRPSRDSVEAELRKLPVPIKDAVEKLHLQEPRRTYEELVSEIGKETADARLKHAYVFLTRKFKVPFPESFEELSS